MIGPTCLDFSSYAMARVGVTAQLMVPFKLQDLGLMPRRSPSSASSEGDRTVRRSPVLVSKAVQPHW